MKIFIPFKIKDIGGTSTFASIFSNGLKKRNIEVTFDFCNDFDVLFIIADCPLKYVFYAKWKKKKIIQRLDGVYNFAANGWAYPLLNAKIKIIYNWLSDSVVYQSKFSKFSCKTILGKTRAKETVIIYNGVDTEKIKPRENILPSDKIRLLTFAKFRRIDQIKPLIESVKLLDQKKFSFDIYGSYDEKLKSILKNLPEHIKFRGKKNHEDLLKTISQYDIFLFSDQSACPNSVLEAMAAGLAIVAFDRGSINELVKLGYNKEVIILEKHNAFKNSYPFKNTDYLKFSEKIAVISSGRRQYKNNARLNSEKKFEIKEMTENYINLMIKK
jgi:glycosyltransferase involved in cell wall biosynthesis